MSIHYFENKQNVLTSNHFFQHAKPFTRVSLTESTTTNVTTSKFQIASVQFQQKWRKKTA